MDDRAGRLETRVEEIARSVEELAQRVRVLEGAMGREAAAAGPEEIAAVEETPAPAAGAGPADGSLPEAEGSLPEAEGSIPEAEGSAWGGLALVGRTLMVLGGAYLFRALTEAGTVPAPVGLLLGLAYAFLWLVFADRAAVAGRARSAAFHGASFALIAEPLAWEAAGRFGAVGAAGGALGVAVFTGCALGLAWWRRLRAVAWIAVLGAIFSAWALMASIEPVLPAVAVLVAVTVAADWLSRPRRGPDRVPVAETPAGATTWHVLPWIPALATDLTLAVIVVESVFGRPEVLEDRAGFVWLLLALFVGAAGSAVVRALAAPRWRPRWLDLVQVPAAVAIGYCGAWGLARALVRYGVSGPELTLGLGLGSAVLAAGLYGVAFPLVDRRPERRPAYLLLTILGLVLAMGGVGLLLPAGGRALVWSVLAVAGVWASGRWRTVTLGLQGFVYAVLAAIDSGLLVDAAVAFVADPAGSPEAGGPAWPELSPVALAVLAALAVAASLRLPAESPFWGRAARVPKLLLLGALAWGAGGAILAVALPWVAGGEMGPALVAAVRTGFVAGMALLLAWLSRFERFVEARWLVYAVLAAGALKLVVEDVVLGRPGELFVALAVFGGALILAPRLARG